MLQQLTRSALMQLS